MSETFVAVVPARLYEDEYDPLGAVRADVVIGHDLEGWALDVEWADDQRQQIIVRYTRRA